MNTICFSALWDYGDYTAKSSKQYVFVLPFFGRSELRREKMYSFGSFVEKIVNFLKIRICFVNNFFFGTSKITGRSSFFQTLKRVNLFEFGAKIENFLKTETHLFKSLRSYQKKTCFLGQKVSNNV